MALFRIKRKKSTGNNNVKLLAGEPYYNLADKRLYVGDSDNQSLSQKKHVAQITNLDSAANGKIKFQIGEDPTNVYEKELQLTITGVQEAAANVTTSINGVNISEIFESDGKKVKNATYADRAGNAGVPWKTF